MHEINLRRYYNRFYDNPQYIDYKQLLFRAGDSLQSAELNEIQQTLKNDIGYVTKRFLSNGDFVYGGEVDSYITLNGNKDNQGNDLYDVTIECKGGVIFANGEFVLVEDKTIVKTDVLEENANYEIGVLIKYRVILEDEDTSLLDPAINTRNHGNPGAGRLKITGDWFTKDEVTEDQDNAFFKIFDIENGEVVRPEVITDDELTRKITDIVAKYDRNSNGNYIIEGYETSFIKKDSYLGDFYFQISEGSANVLGYNIEKDFVSEITLPKLIDYELKQSEPINFTSDGWYETRHKPIRKVFRISGKKTITMNITHGSYSGAVDALPAEYTPVVDIVSVKQGNVVYQKGTDFVQDGDSINWGPSGNEPAPNTTYTVTWVYQHTEQNTFSGQNGSLNSERSALYIEGFDPNTIVSIDYDFVLSRVDTIYLDVDGKFNYVKGTPREFSPLAPNIDEENSLRIADVVLHGVQDPEIELNGQKVFKMSDIQKILDDIRDAQYNIQRIALNIDTKDKLAGLKLKNSFVETFENDDQRDPGYESVSGYKKAEAIAGGLILEKNWDTIPIKCDFSGKRILTMSVSGTSLFLKQPHYTKTRKINEFMFKSPPAASIRVSPTEYHWVDRNIYRSYVSNIVNTFNCRRWWWHPSFRWMSRFCWGSKNQGWVRHTSRLVGTVSKKSQTIIRQRTPSIIPNITLKITSDPKDFNSNEQIDIFFNNKKVKTSTADSNGRLNDSFTIPNGEVSGVKSVMVKGKSSGVQGQTLFRAIPLTRIVTNRIYRYWRRFYWYDPVAQTFTPNRDIVIDKVKIWYDKAPITRAFCGIMETTAGIPDRNKLLTIKMVQPGSISDNSPYVWEFDDKITLKANQEYAIFVGCDDAIGSVQVARLGERTIDTGEWLTSQSYNLGVLLTSSNSSTWTPIQEEDLRFEIYETRFVSEETFEYKTLQQTDIQVTDATEMMLVSTAEVENGSSVSYKITLLDTVPQETYEVDPNIEFRIKSGSYTGRVKVEVKMKSNGLKTPNLDPSAQLYVGTSSNESYYTSMGINFDPNDSKLIAILDQLTETGSSVEVFAQIKKNGTLSWEKMTPVSGEELGDDWKEVRYELDINSINPDVDQDITRIRIKLSTTNIASRPFVSNLRLNSVSL